MANNKILTTTSTPEGVEAPTSSSSDLTLSPLSDPTPAPAPREPKVEHVGDTIRIDY